MTDEVRAEQAKQMFRDAMEFARLGIRAAFLLNGGAIVGILTFLGQVFTYRGAVPLLISCKHALPFFILGVFFASISLAIAFFAQEHFYIANVTSLDGQQIRRQFEGKFPQENIDKAMKPLEEIAAQRTAIAGRVRLIAIAACGLSFALFLFGSFVAYSGL